MVLLSEADAIYLGANGPADAVYLGNSKIWPPELNKLLAHWLWDDPAGDIAGIVPVDSTKLLPSIVDASVDGSVHAILGPDVRNDDRTPFAWPGTGGANSITLTAVGSSSGTDPDTYSGDWADYGCYVELPLIPASEKLIKPTLMSFNFAYGGSSQPRGVGVLISEDGFNTFVMSQRQLTGSRTGPQVFENIPLPFTTFGTNHSVRILTWSPSTGSSVEQYADGRAAVDGTIIYGQEITLLSGRTYSYRWNEDVWLGERGYACMQNDGIRLKRETLDSGDILGLSRNTLQPGDFVNLDDGAGTTYKYKITDIPGTGGATRILTQPFVTADIFPLDTIFTVSFTRE